MAKAVKKVSQSNIIKSSKAKSVSTAGASTDSFFDGIINTELLALYVRYFQSNQRQGTAKTKTRSEVSGGGVKPFRQKGTGRARTGSRRGPTHVHGGISHGPVPRSYNISLTPLMKKGALKSALNQKNNAEAILYISTVESKKTADAVKFLKTNAIIPTTTKSLIVLPKQNVATTQAFSNIATASVCVFSKVNAYDIMHADKVIFIANSFELLKERI